MPSKQVTKGGTEWGLGISRIDSKSDIEIRKKERGSGEKDVNQERHEGYVMQVPLQVLTFPCIGITSEKRGKGSEESLHSNTSPSATVPVPFCAVIRGTLCLLDEVKHRLINSPIDVTIEADFLQVASGFIFFQTILYLEIEKFNGEKYDIWCTYTCHCKGNGTFRYGILEVVGIRSSQGIWTTIVELRT
jgi:hypothetical protein